MGWLRTCRTAPTTECSLYPLAKKSSDDETKKIHKSLVSEGYEGGKHGNSKILQVFYLYKA